ncbi:MAG: rubredoxin [bacterium]|nr:MAG: rubredoxin [bacterium]
MASCPTIIFNFEEYLLTKYVCTNYSYIYDPMEGDPENGITPGIPFEDLPDDWTCPLCYVGKDMFDPL